TDGFRGAAIMQSSDTILYTLVRFWKRIIQLCFAHPIFLPMSKLLIKCAPQERTLVFVIKGNHSGIGRSVSKSKLAEDDLVTNKSPEDTIFIASNQQVSA